MHITERDGQSAENCKTEEVFDYRLYMQDIRSSIACAKVLSKTGSITKGEAALIIKGLVEVLYEIETGRFDFHIINEEDIHTNIEKRLIERIGPVGGKLRIVCTHNDWASLDVRMYLRDEIPKISELITDLQNIILYTADHHTGTAIPERICAHKGYPVSLANCLMAYYHMLKRDRQRLENCAECIDVMPLSAESSEVVVVNDLEFTAELLGFAKIYDNGIDAINDMDWIIEFLSSMSICMAHLSRLFEQIILWYSEEFGYVKTDVPFAAESGAELVRRKTMQVFDDLMARMLAVKELPLGHQTDIIEDKKALFNTVDAVKACLTEAARVISATGFKSGDEAHSASFKLAADIVGQKIKVAREELMEYKNIIYHLKCV